MDDGSMDLVEGFAEVIMPRPITSMSCMTKGSSARL